MSKDIAGGMLSIVDGQCVTADKFTAKELEIYFYIKFFSGSTSKTMSVDLGYASRTGVRDHVAKLLEYKLITKLDDKLFFNKTLF